MKREIVIVDYPLDKVRKHKLLTMAIARTLPKLRSTDGQGQDATVRVKFFTPDSDWTWFVTEGEYDSEVGDWTLFGYVQGFANEWGYFSLGDIASVRGPLGLPVERDTGFFGLPLVAFLCPSDEPFFPVEISPEYAKDALREFEADEARIVANESRNANMVLDAENAQKSAENALRAVHEASVVIAELDAEMLVKAAAIIAELQSDMGEGS